MFTVWNFIKVQTLSIQRGKHWSPVVSCNAIYDAYKIPYRTSLMNMRWVSSKFLRVLLLTRAENLSPTMGEESIPGTESGIE